MPDEANAAQGGVDLLELRVLDGPNRFFSRPALKLEFRAGETGGAVETAASAGLAVRRLHLALGMPAPEITSRRSADDRAALVAFPWRRRTVSQAIGAAAARIALGRSDDAREMPVLRATALGPLADLRRPTIPVVSVTGTNGKSTTVRMIAHVAAAAGRRVGMTNSDGIYLRGELVEAGDWTGFGGAGRVLDDPDIDLAVLETARGGILLRGMGCAYNDVGVVTNISADHLGLNGVDTLDELAEVKAAVVRITRRAGWAVLNGEDPLVWAMRRESAAHPYAFALDPDAPAVAAALEAGGRAAVLDRGWIVLRAEDRPPRRLLKADAVPITFSGRARHNVANALAAAAASDALGIAPRVIADALSEFRPDAEANPGRLNLFDRDGIRVLVDFAHNEAGLTSLLDVARAIAAGGRVRLGLGTAGDRSDEVLRSLGRIAGESADEVVIAEKLHYLRGRDREQMNALLRSGAAEAGYRDDVPACGSEVEALAMLVDHAQSGDIVALMTHADRKDVFAWLAAHGFSQAAAS